MIAHSLRVGVLALALGTAMAPIAAFAQHDEHAHDEGVDFEEAHEALHGEHPHVTLGMIFADKQFLASMITFLVLVGLIWFLAGKKINAALQARRREIMENLEEAQRKKAEAEALREEYADRLSRMGDELERVRGEMIKAGEQERDRIVTDAEQKAAAMRRETQFQIEQKFKQLRDDLTAETVKAAIAAAQERVATEATMSDQTRLAEDYLANIGAAASPDEVRS